MTTSTTACRRCGLALLAGVLLACGGGSKKEQLPPADPQSVTDKVGDSSAALATGYLAALEALETSAAAGALQDGLAPLQRALGALLGNPVAIPTGLSLPRFPAEDFAAYLGGRVFTAANVESRDGTSVTYLLPASAVCPYDLADGSHGLAPVAGAPLSPLCVSLVDGLGLRVRATEPAADEVALAFLIGDSRASPLAVRLTPGAAVFTVSLTGAGDLLRSLLAGATGVELAMSGEVELRLERDPASGAGGVTFAAAITAPLYARLASQGEEVVFGSEARSPLFSVRVEPASGRVVTVANLGVTTLAMPWDDGSGEPTGKQTEVTLGGLTFASTVEGGQSGDFVASGFGLGSVRTQVAIGGERYLSLDLTPRQVEVAFRPDPLVADRTILGAPDGSRLTVYADTRLVGGVDPSFAGRSYDFVLASGAGRPELELYEASGAVVLKVVQGSFTIDDGARTLTVPAGQCLLRNPPAVTDTWVDDYTAGPCP